MNTVQYLRRLNGWLWGFLILGALAATISQIVLDRDKSAILVGFGAFIAWIGWFVFSRWLFGLRRHVVAFMGQPVEKLTFADKHVSNQKVVDVLISLQHHCQNNSAKILATSAGVELKFVQSANPACESLVWRTVDVEGGSLINIAENGVYFIESNRRRAVIKASFADATTIVDDEIDFPSRASSIQLIAATIEDANLLIQWLIKQSSVNSIYRGQMLNVHSSSQGGNSCTVEIAKRPTAKRERIVLPDEIISLAERLVRNRSKYQSQLSKLGHSSRLGLLFYGPPGTGKTLVTKLLISQIPDHTVVVPVDLAPGTLRECFRLAAYLEPTIVVIEDVDLLASNRTSASSSLDSLQELMNQLDGLSTSSNTMIVLTTKRPDVLEPALATRPGRISQAIEFTLPDQQARLQLMKLFLGDLDKRLATNIDLEAWAARTDKASPAFLQELCKRAIQLSCERQATQVSVSDDDLREAMHQLVVVGGQLNRSVLGFASA